MEESEEETIQNIDYLEDDPYVDKGMVFVPIKPEDREPVEPGFEGEEDQESEEYKHSDMDTEELDKFFQDKMNEYSELEKE